MRNKVRGDAPGVPPPGTPSVVCLLSYLLEVKWLFQLSNCCLRNIALYYWIGFQYLLLMLAIVSWLCHTAHQFCTRTQIGISEYERINYFISSRQSILRNLCHADHKNYNKFSFAWIVFIYEYNFILTVCRCRECLYYLVNKKWYIDLYY